MIKASIALMATVVNGQTQECATANLTGCITRSLSQIVNQALANGTTLNFTGPMVSTPGTLSNAKGLASASPMSMTINECAQVLSERLTSFGDFKTKSDEVWTDVSAVQTAMAAVEQAAKDIQSVEAGYAIQMAQAGELFSNATDRSAQLNSWLSGEKVIRNQLTDLYSALDTKVMNTSDKVLLTASSIRDALLQMQKVHDHASSILTGVGDAETVMYEWAFNVSQAINRHTVNLVSIAQTLQYRSSQMQSVKNSNVQLNWIVTQLYQKYGADKLAELNKEYDDGTLTTPSGTAQGPNSTSTTSGGSTTSVNS